MSDLIFFNVADGYAEALLRGFRKTFLGESTYAAIRNTNSLKDLKGVMKIFQIFSNFHIKFDF